MSGKHKWLELVKLLAPVVLATVPHADKLAPIVPMIMNGIDEAEQMPGATGLEKKAHVLALVATGVSITNASGKAHLDPVAIATIAGHGIDAVIGTVNAVRDAHQAGPMLP